MLIDNAALESAEDPVLQEDLYAVTNSGVPYDQLQGSTVLITGATGLIGAQIVRTLACFNRVKSANIRIIAFVRSQEKATKVFGSLLGRGDVVLRTGDINSAIEIEGTIDYIIHGASATSSRYFVTNPVETIFTAIEGTKNVLDFARKKQVKGLVYLSSLEVYGVPQKDTLITEADYGSIDPLSVRSSYSEGKRMVECLCVSYGEQYQVPVKIARLSQTFGAGVEYNDSRVFAEFARCAIEKRNIVLHTKGNTIRSYCYTSDAVSAILYVLLKGQPKEAYNVTNMDTAISVKNMAQMVCDTFSESGISVEFDLPKDLTAFGFNPEMIIRLDSTKLMELGWHPTVSLREMFLRLVASMR